MPTVVFCQSKFTRSSEEKNTICLCYFSQLQLKFNVNALYNKFVGINFRMFLMKDLTPSSKEAVFYKKEKTGIEWLSFKFGGDIPDTLNSSEVRILGPYGCLV
jgi:hypothetical protein